MKVSIKTLFMVLAIVMSFVAAQAVSAQGVDSGPYTVTGTVISGTGDGLVLKGWTITPDPEDSLLNEDGTISVYGLGPDSYWESYGVALPASDDSVEIKAYVIDDDSYHKLVAVEVTNTTDTNNVTYIELRKVLSDDQGVVYLIPMWSNNLSLKTVLLNVIYTNETLDIAKQRQRQRTPDKDKDLIHTGK